MTNEMLNFAKIAALRLGLMVVACLVLSANSYAAMTITIYESGSDVKIDASGSLKIPQLDTSSITLSTNSVTPGVDFPVK